MTSSEPNYLPKALPANTIAVGFRVLIYELREGTYIQSIIIT